MLLERALRVFRKKVPASFQPRLAVVLGSGLDCALEPFRTRVQIPFEALPGFSGAGVAGHRGILKAGEVAGQPALVFLGRLHYYEGHPMEEVAFPARLACALGVRRLFLTAAVGSLRRDFRPGDLVVVRDHINGMGANPLRGIHRPEWGERFLDLSQCYSPRLRRAALRAARRFRVRIHEGVYCAACGPTYETPAEARAWRILGGDVAGMSTVPETIAAHQMGCEVLALASVANYAAGLSSRPLSHAAVLEQGRKNAGAVARVLRAVIEQG